MKNSDQRGFTLIELIVTVVVLAIFASIAVPSYSEWIERERLSRAVSDMNNLIQFARTETLKTDTNMYVVYTVGDSWCSAVQTTSTALNCASNITDRHVTYTSYSNVEMVSPAASSYFYFDKVRGVPVGSSDFTFENSLSDECSLSVSMLGMVTIDGC
ncbi:Fimbrial protein precursor [Marinobacterium sp. xm-a-121]|uniref:pilus assembly FimT family protein n=1 Tax=unclassified Marinobacterium TaxID=2644139 RepID=UPI001568C5A1|nr:MULTISPECIES: GspH/FimT family pseudopilin [unclassified Marinobacterium]NRP37666.1 Fimbrial protein precursor [Marinobacterium sp. xm-a-121]NRQ00614.1 Fimbrial protein precursor [Marinobacterium sp. xm-v-233]